MQNKTDYQKYIFKSRYARYLEKEDRREEWEETVQRYIDFFTERAKGLSLEEVKEAILNYEVMPSMRSLMTAGKALERDNVCGYNCSYVADSPRVFDEILYILCCGTGVGFSVERQYVNKLPEVAEDFVNSSSSIIVEDSKIGWVLLLLENLSPFFMLVKSLM